LNGLAYRIIIAPAQNQIKIASEVEGQVRFLKHFLALAICELHVAIIILVFDLFLEISSVCYNGLVRRVHRRIWLCSDRKYRGCWVVTWFWQVEDGYALQSLVFSPNLKAVRSRGWHLSGQVVCTTVSSNHIINVSIEAFHFTARGFAGCCEWYRLGKAKNPVNYLEVLRCRVCACASRWKNRRKISFVWETWQPGVKCYLFPSRTCAQKIILICFLCTS
jgi:hypothetical protein